MAGTIAPFPKHQFFDNNGDPASGYKLFTYAAGTTTKQATYTDVDLSVANANPIVLDSAGRATIFLSPLSYKFVLATPTDTDPPGSPLWTQDNVSAVPILGQTVDITILAGVDLSEGELAYLSDGTGGLTAGRWYTAEEGTIYKSEYADALAWPLAFIASGQSGLARLWGTVTTSGLTPGNRYYVGAGGAVSSVAGLFPRVIGVAGSSTSLILGEKRRTQNYLAASQLTTVGNVGAGEDILFSYSAGAGKVPNDGEGFFFLAWGRTANNANVKTIRLRTIEGANNTVVCTWAPVINEAGHWILRAWIYRTGTTTGRTGCIGESGPAATNATAGDRRAGTPTITWANAVEIRLTGDATANDDVTVEYASVQVQHPGNA